MVCTCVHCGGQHRRHKIPALVLKSSMVDEEWIPYLWIHPKHVLWLVQWFWENVLQLLSYYTPFWDWNPEYSPSHHKDLTHLPLQIGFDQPICIILLFVPRYFVLWYLFDFFIAGSFPFLVVAFSFFLSKAVPFFDTCGKFFHRDILGKIKEPNKNKIKGKTCFWIFFI